MPLLDLLFAVNRDSPTERIRSFVDLGFALQDRLKFLATLQGNIITRLLVNNLLPVHIAMLFWSLLINVFMVATWQANGDHQNPIPDVEDWYYPVIWTLGAVHVLLALLVVLGHFLADPPIQFGLKSEEDDGDDGNAQLDDEEEEDEKDFLEGATLSNQSIMNSNRKKGSFLGPKLKKLGNKTLEILAGIMMYFRFNDLYHLAFLAMSILGFFFSGYTYCFHLLHVVVSNDILIRVLQSVTKNGSALIWVSILGVVIIYIYSVISFAFYRGSFDYQSDLWCDSLWECFLTCLDWGLRDGLGDVLAADNFVWTNVGLKIIYNISFFIIISTIGLNIIFGIIVDTFSELRDERYRIVDDMQSVCFICSLPSHDFDRHASGFLHHIRKEHNMWGYLLFAKYLDGKNPSEYTAFEAYVADQINRNEISWYPINRAMALAQEDTTIEDELRKMWAGLEYLINRHKEDDIRKVVEGNKTSHQKWKEEAKEEKDEDEE